MKLERELVDRVVQCLGPSLYMDIVGPFTAVVNGHSGFRRESGSYPGE